jgi:hypothetical protein
MKSIQTVYPCPNCEAENRPVNQFCSACGTKLPNWADGNIYNLFYRQVGSPLYNLMFGGDPILTLDDAKEAAWENIEENHGRWEFYIGAYPVNTSIDEGVAFSVKEWYGVGHNRITSDLGPTMVRVTHLEK